MEGLSATLFAAGLRDWGLTPLEAAEGKGGGWTVPVLLLSEVALFCRVKLLKGRVVGRLEPAESGEGPCALVRAQERMRSTND